MVRIWLAVAAVAFLLAAPSGGRAEGDAWTALQILEGHWREVKGTAVNEEVWLNNSGNVIVGMSRSVDGLSNSFEFLRIENRKAGIVYIAQPQGGQETAFPLLSHSTNTVVFGNPAHDWPGRITYRRTGAETLEATVSGFDGKGRVLTFKWTRVR